MNIKIVCIGCHLPKIPGVTNLKKVFRVGWVNVSIRIVLVDGWFFVAPSVLLCALPHSALSCNSSWMDIFHGSYIVNCSKNAIRFFNRKPERLFIIFFINFHPTHSIQDSSLLYWFLCSLQIQNPASLLVFLPLLFSSYLSYPVGSFFITFHLHLIFVSPKITFPFTIFLSIAPKHFCYHSSHYTEPH